MKTRHIALLGFTASSFLAMTLAGCSASEAPATKKKDADHRRQRPAQAARRAPPPSGASGSPTTAGAGGNSIDPVTGAGGATPVECTPPDATTKAPDCGRSRGSR